MRHRRAAKQCIWLGPDRYSCSCNRRIANTDTDGNVDSNSNAYRDSDGNCYVDGYRYADCYTYSNSYCYAYTNTNSDRYGSAYGDSLRYAAMQYWVVGGTSFPQHPGPLGGCLFLWGLGPQVLRHGRALGRYSWKRLHTSV